MAAASAVETMLSTGTLIQCPRCHMGGKQEYKFRKGRKYSYCRHGSGKNTTHCYLGLAEVTLAAWGLSE